MALEQTLAAKFQAVHQFPVAALPVGALALDLQQGPPASLAQGLRGGRAPQPDDLSPQPTGAAGQPHPGALLVETVGIEHQILGQPLQVSAGPNFEAELLAGPGAGGAEAGAAD